MRLRRFTSPLTVATVLGGGGVSAFNDDFARDDGDLGNGWEYTAGLWTIASGEVLGTPGLGAELNTTAGATSDPNGNESDANGVMAAIGTGAVLSRISSGQHTGAYALQLQTAVAANSRMAHIATSAAYRHKIYRVSVYAKHGVFAGTTPEVRSENVAYPVQGFPTTADWAEYKYTTLVGQDGHYLYLQTVTPASGDLFYADNYSLKALNIADLFASRNYGASDVTVSTRLTVQNNYQAGLVLCLDSVANPQNYIICYLGLARAGIKRLFVVKCVAGLFTVVLNEVASFTTGDVLAVEKSGTTVKAYLNGAQVGTDKTINDAGVVSNTRHGLYTTDAQNRFQEVSINPR